MIIKGWREEETSINSNHHHKNLYAFKIYKVLSEGERRTNV